MEKEETALERYANLERKVSTIVKEGTDSVRMANGDVVCKRFIRARTFEEGEEASYPIGYASINRSTPFG